MNHLPSSALKVSIVCSAWGTAHGNTKKQEQEITAAKFTLVTCHNVRAATCKYELQDLPKLYFQTIF